MWTKFPNHRSLLSISRIPIKSAHLPEKSTDSCTIVTGNLWKIRICRRIMRVGALTLLVGCLECIWPVKNLALAIPEGSWTWPNLEYVHIGTGLYSAWLRETKFRTIIIGGRGRCLGSMGKTREPFFSDLFYSRSHILTEPPNLAWQLICGMEEFQWHSLETRKGSRPVKKILLHVLLWRSLGDPA